MSASVEKDAAGSPVVSQSQKLTTERWSCQQRKVLVTLASLGLLLIYNSRINMNIVIVRMLNHTAVESAQHENQPPRPDGPFVWDPIQQGVVLGAFFWGFFITPIAGGVLAKRCSAKGAFGGSILSSAVLGVFIPEITTRFGYFGLVVIRFLQGLSEGMVLPALQTLLGHWIPTTERATAVTYCYLGASLGCTFGMLTTSALASTTFFGGWPAVFYVSNTCTVLWCVPWFALTAETPGSHARISEEELRLITEDLGPERFRRNKTPWKEILRSRPVWATHVAFFGALYLHYVLLTEMPSYLSQIFGIGVGQNGLLSSLPHIGAICIAMAGGPLGDSLVASRRLSATASRKLLQGIGTVVPSLILITLTSFAGNSIVLTVILFVLAGSLRCVAQIGVATAAIDLAPAFVGVLLGLSMTVGATAGVCVPLVTGLLTESEGSLRTWSHTFYVAGTVGLLSTVIFQIFGSAELQPWAKDLPTNRSSLLETHVIGPEAAARDPADSTPLAQQSDEPQEAP